MHPLVGEVNLHAVDIVNLLVCIHFLDFCKNSIDISSRRKVYAVLGNVIVGESRTQLAHLASLVSQ